jgi:hypothetical protein
MTDDKIDLQDRPEMGSGAALLREMIGFAAQCSMELQVGKMTAAAMASAAPCRLVQRNGYRDND